MTGSTIVIFILLLIISYFIGGVLPSIILNKVKYKIDVRKFGSKNPGAANVQRVIQKKSITAAVLLIDAGKIFFC
jgi:glycerol-3-phosphate acyltransferase PlsY